MRHAPAHHTCLLATLAVAMGLATACASARSGLTKASIRRTVRAHTGEITRCYRLARERQPELRSGGRLAANFIIAPDGSVMHVRSTQVPLDDQYLGACAEAALRTWRFGRPGGEGIVVVTYAFRLEPGGRVVGPGPRRVPDRPR